jgi:hypothetical protein
LPNWCFDSCDIAQYNAKSGISEKRAMAYHTDYEQAKHPEPGNKFAITCLFYLNGDYEGGEIAFRIYNEDQSDVLEYIKYKPSEGDVIVFPSGDPRYTGLDNFYHGVSIVDSGTKYIIRSYWKYSYDGDIEHIEESLKYSSEEWERILKSRRDLSWKETSHKVNEEDKNEYQ